MEVNRQLLSEAQMRYATDAVFQIKVDNVIYKIEKSQDDKLFPFQKEIMKHMVSYNLLLDEYKRR